MATIDLLPADPWVLGAPSSKLVCIGRELDAGRGPRECLAT